MKELEKEFDGIGEVRGFHFVQSCSNGLAYIYEVSHPDIPNVHYEVFERRENTQFDCVSYPKSTSFGIWAWTVSTWAEAVVRYNEITERKSRLFSESKEK